jgi:hypothetical protein
MQLDSSFCAIKRALDIRVRERKNRLDDMPVGAIVVKKCIFKRCTFIGIGFVSNPQSVEEFNQTMKLRSQVPVQSVVDTARSQPASTVPTPGEDHAQGSDGKELGSLKTPRLIWDRHVQFGIYGFLAKSQFCSAFGKFVQIRIRGCQRTAPASWETRGIDVQ